MATETKHDAGDVAGQPAPGACGACRFLIFAALLCAFIAIVYRDSLAHVHRGDQLCFLEDTLECDSFAQTVQKTYSYTRSRFSIPGDVLLFRPVLFVFLSLELAVFEARRTMLWQLTSLVLHGAATVLLFAVLLRLWRPWQRSGLFVARTWKEYFVPFSVAAFFSINCSTVEQVVWTHIAGYTLFAVFFLSSFWCLLAAMQAADDRPGLRRLALIGCWGAAALASLTYELGPIYSLALVVVMPFVQPGHSPLRRIKTGLVFFLIPLGFFAWNWLDWIERQDYIRTILGGQGVQFIGDNQAAVVQSSVFSFSTFEYFWRYFNYAIIQPFIPGKDFTIGNRLSYEEPGPALLFAKLLRWDLMSLIGTVVLLSWWLFLAMGLFFVWQGRARVRWSLVLLAGTCCAAHMGLIVVGRMLSRTNVLADNPYYPYMTLLTFLLAFFHFLRWACRTSRPHAVCSPRCCPRSSSSRRRSMDRSSWPSTP